jgi:hypothetical protein
MKTRAKEINIDDNLSFNLKRLTNLGDAVNPTDAINYGQVLELFKMLPIKDPVKTSSNGDIPLAWSYDNSTDEWNGVTAGNTLDAVAIADGNRLLIADDGDRRGNGIWLFDAANNKLVRADDANSSSELFSGVIVVVQEGSNNADKVFELKEPDTDIVFGTSEIVWEEKSSTQIIFPQLSSTEITPLVTVGNSSPTGAVLGSSVEGEPIAFVNGRSQVIGYADKTKAFYFSSDAGVTSQTVSEIGAGSELYWNGIESGFELDANDLIQIFIEA